MSVREAHVCEHEGRIVTIYERSAFDGTATSVVELWYECAAPLWPKVRIRSRRGLAALLLRFGRRPGIELDLEEFNDAFRVDAEDEDFAIALLSQEMQQFLLEKPGVDWSVGHGLLKLFYRGGLRRKKIAASLDRFGRFWQYVAPELGEWDQESL